MPAQERLRKLQFQVLLRGHFAVRYTFEYPSHLRRTEPQNILLYYKHRNPAYKCFQPFVCPLRPIAWNVIWSTYVTKFPYGWCFLFKLFYNKCNIRCKHYWHLMWVQHLNFISIGYYSIMLLLQAFHKLFIYKPLKPVWLLCVFYLVIFNCNC